MNKKQRRNRRRSNHEGSMTQRKDGRWQASIMIDGNRYYFYSYQKEECINWLTEQRTKLMQNLPITKDVTFVEWVQHYIEVRAKGFVRPATLANYICYCVKHIAPHSIAKVKLSKLTADHIQMFVNGLKRLDSGEALKAKTVRNIWQFISAALAYAVDCGLIWRNVAERVKLRKADTKKRPFLTDDDVRKLIQTAAEDGHPWKIGITALTLGLRISELLALRRSSIITQDGIPCLNITQALKREYNFEAKPGEPKTVLHLSRPKTDSSIRKVPITPSIMKELNRHLTFQEEQATQSYGLYEADPFIIGSSLGNMTDPGSFRTYFSRIVEKAGLPKTVTPHALRHYAASSMIRHGASPVGAARVLGHRQPNTTLNIYCDESLTGAFDSIMTLNNVTEQVLPL